MSTFSLDFNICLQFSEEIVHADTLFGFRSKLAEMMKP